MLRTCSWPPLHWGEAVISMLTHVAPFGGSLLNLSTCKNSEERKTKKRTQSWGEEISVEDSTNVQSLKWLFFFAEHLWELLELSSASCGPLSSRPWPTKKPKEDLQEESKHVLTPSQNTTLGPWHFGLVDSLSHLWCLHTEQLLMDSKTSWRDYGKKNL